MYVLSHGARSVRAIPVDDGAGGLGEETGPARREVTRRVPVLYTETAGRGSGEWRLEPNDPGLAGADQPGYC